MFPTPFKPVIKAHKATFDKWLLEQGKKNVGAVASALHCPLARFYSEHYGYSDVSVSSEIGAKHAPGRKRQQWELAVMMVVDSAMSGYWYADKLRAALARNYPSIWPQWISRYWLDEEEENK